MRSNVEVMSVPPSKRKCRAVDGCCGVDHQRPAGD